MPVSPTPCPQPLATTQSMWQAIARSLRVTFVRQQNVKIKHHHRTHLVRAAFNPGVILSTPDLHVANGQDAVAPGELNEEILATNSAGAVDFTERASCAPSECQTCGALSGSTSAAYASASARKGGQGAGGGR